MPMPDIVRKGALREAIASARAALTAEQWAADDAERTRHVLAAVDEFPAGTASVYLSLPGEPDTSGIIDGLTERGWRVLVPKLRRSPDWGWFTGWDDLTPGWAGIPQPSSRLGTGGGWYDRALAHRRSDALLVALSRADEVLDTIPSEPHDVSIHGYATERGWVVR